MLPQRRAAVQIAAILATCGAIPHPRLMRAGASTMAAPLVVLALVAGGVDVRADPLAALGGDTIEVAADAVDVDVSAGTATLTGQVRLTRGSLRVECPRVEVRYDDRPRVTWARGTGGVRADVKGVHAEAPEVELDLDKHVVELRGGVRLARGQGWLQADAATIDTRTARVALKDVRGAIPVAPAP